MTVRTAALLFQKFELELRNPEVRIVYGNIASPPGPIPR